MSVEKQKGVEFRVTGKEQRDILDLFHPAPASTESCLLSDFYLKPTPVMGNNIWLHSAKDKVTKVRAQLQCFW